MNAQLDATPEIDTAGLALQVHAKAAGIDTLELALCEQARHQPAPGHALVRVLAAAVNPSDVKACLGLMPQAVWPRTPGRDFAGVVRRAGLGQYH